MNAALLVLALVVSDAAPITPPPQTVVFYNARTASREGKPKEVLRLWLLRNALESQGHTSPHDGEFRSLLWDALAETGYCQDGLVYDTEGAGLWPLALHNWLLKSTSKQPAPPQPPPFTSLEAGFQQRFVSLQDVLSLEEMTSLRFYRGNCLIPYFMLAKLPTFHWVDLRDRLSIGVMMRDLLELSKKTLDEDRVQTRVLIDTRLFDLEVALSKLAAQRVRRETGVLAQLARSTGVSPAGVQLMRDQRMAEFRKSEYAALLQQSLTWSAASWLSLSKQRRLALFGTASENAEDLAARDAAILRLVDAHTARADGGELAQWLGFAAVNPALVGQITSGARGEALLSLAPKPTKFRERSTIALHRGVAFLRVGEQQEALRSFAFALGHADESRDAETVHNLSKRWLAYVLSQYETDEEVLAILNEFVGRLDYDELVEILLWRAAFHVDSASFARIEKDARRSRRLDRTIRQLRPLAAGDAGAMYNAIREEFEEKPHSVFSFADRVVEELALESIDVRSNQRRTLEITQGILDETMPAASKSVQKKIAEVQARIQALLEGIDAFDESVRGRARAAGPDYEAYAGSVRLAPADPLPWPFTAPIVEPPSAFTPIELTPVEWRDDNDELVFGWKIHE